jgi:hypothetical protein
MSKKASWILGMNDVEDFAFNERRYVAQGVREPYGTCSSAEMVKVHPQATTDPLDPLNWTTVKKHTILGIVMGL